MKERRWKALLTHDPFTCDVHAAAAAVTATCAGKRVPPAPATQRESGSIAAADQLSPRDASDAQAAPYHLDAGSRSGNQILFLLIRRDVRPKIEETRVCECVFLPVCSSGGDGGVTPMTTTPSRSLPSLSPEHRDGDPAAKSMTTSPSSDPATGALIQTTAAGQLPPSLPPVSL